MLGPNRYEQTAVVDTGVDAGLRAHMLKVYNYMITGLLVTAFTSWLVLQPALFNLMMVDRGNGSYSPNLLWMIIVVAPLLMVFVIGNYVGKNNPAAAKTWFYIYSATMGLSLGILIYSYGQVAAFRAFAAAAAAFGGMSLYGYQTKRDLTPIGSFCRMAVIGIIVALLINMFLASSSMDWIISVVTVLVFSGLTAYDTAKIKNMYREDSDNEAIAIYGALNLYIDFINMFIALMRLFSDRR